MKTAYLSTVVVAGGLMLGCGGGAAPCPEPAVPQVAAADTAGKKEAAAKAPAEEAAPPQIEGAYRVVEHRDGKNVTNIAKALLAQAPSCYAVRMLWRFQKESLGISMDMLCDTAKDMDHSVDYCQASLELGIQWTKGGFKVPVSAQAEGTVDRYALKFEPIPGGMKRSRNKLNRSCNVSIKASALTIKEKGESLVLATPEGDLVLAPEPEPELDWGREAQRLYEERHGAK